MECQKNLDCANNIVNLRRVLLCRKLKCKTFDTVLYCFYLLCASLLLFVPSVSCDLDWPSQLTYDSIFNHTTYVQIEHNKYNPENKYTYQQNTQNYDSSDYDSNESPNNYIEEDLDYTNTGPNNFVEDYRVTSPKTKGSGESWLVGFSHDPYRLSVTDKDYEKGVSYKTPPPMKDTRGKRGVMHLYNMIWCATGCEPLMYKGYGCYCGFLGAGRPTDGIDRCCKMHDECYENIYCPFFTVYFQPYYWKCYRGEPLCALENRQTSHQYINGCAAKLCECDRKLAMCLRQYSCPRRRSFCRSSPLRFLQNILTLHVA